MRLCTPRDPGAGSRRAAAAARRALDGSGAAGREGREADGARGPATLTAQVVTWSGHGHRTRMRLTIAVSRLEHRSRESDGVLSNILIYTRWLIIKNGFL